MINQTILYLPQTDCTDANLKPYARELGINVNWNPDLNLGNPLAKIFNLVIRFDIGEEYAEYGVIQANKRIIDLVREHSPKYVIWPTMTYEILEETFQEVRKLGAYVIGWFFDDENRFEGYSRWWIPCMDYIFTADKASISRYQQLGAKAFHLLVTGEPEDFEPTPVDLFYDVSFVGSKYVADRDILVKRFYDDGVSISTFGKGWSNGYISHDEMAQIFCTSKINICFTKSYAGERNQLKGKIFDITMCGGFLLCEYVDGIEDYFEIGKEIVCFNNYTEALEKIHYYLINDDEREMIAKAGKLRSTRDLSQSKLLENVFSAIEIDRVANNTRAVISTPDFEEMPRDIKKAHAQYHLRWAKVLKKEGYSRQRWQEELDLAMFYDPENQDTRFFKSLFRAPDFLVKFILTSRSTYQRLITSARSCLAKATILKKGKQLGKRLKLWAKDLNDQGK